MSFEQNLRDRLSTEASSLALPERAPERAARRAAQRRRARRATVAAVAGTAVLAGAVAVTPQLLGGDDGSPADVAMATPGAAGLVPTGPLDLSWRATDAGFSQYRTRFIDDEGRLFALSTSPGARDEDFPDGDVPRTLYRLGDDGTWEEVPLEGDRPDAVAMSGDDGLLYAVSTGPGEGGGVVARLSSSPDGGDTWSTDDLPAVPAPGDPELWDSSRTMSVESLGGQTVAVVSTTWMPDWAAIFPETVAPDPEVSHTVEYREEGLVLVRVSLGASGAAGTSTGEPPADGDVPTPTAPPTVPPTTVPAEGPTTTVPPTAPPTTGPATEAPASTAPPGDEAEDLEASRTPSPAEDVRTVPWSEVGATGIEALEPDVQVFRRVGEAWEELPEAGAGLDSIVGAQVVTAGDRFVVSGYAAGTPSEAAMTEPAPTAFASTDGVSWTPIPVPLDGTLTSVGSALFVTDTGGTQAQVSADGGVTWSEVDLAAAGVGGDQAVMHVGGGPLGVALVVGDMGSWEGRSLAVSGDLTDWTTIPMADVFGGEFPAGAVVSAPAVGEDTVTLTRSILSGTGEPSESVTVVGTPTR